MVILWVDERGRIITEIRNLFKGYVNPFEDAIKKSKSELQKKLKIEEELMDQIIEQFKTDYDDNVERPLKKTSLRRSKLTTLCRSKLTTS